MIKNKRGESIEKVFIVPYSHIDWAWRNNRQYFIHRNRQVIFAALDFLDEQKDYRWEGIHKFHTVEDFWNNYPEFREKLKKFVQEGRIDLTGSTLMTPLPPWYEEEVMVRNIIYGKKSFEELFGKYEDLTLYFADAADWAFPTLNLLEFVRFWNEKIEKSKLTISTHTKDAFESPLETVARKTKGENKGVFYALRFASLEDKNIGVALFNKGTVGYKVEDNILSNILLRSSKKENLDQYKICPYLLGKGKFVFENAIYPYQSGNRIEVLKKSLEFNFPLFILPNRKAKFSEKLSLLKIGANNIILTAFYKEGDYFHLHLYEAEGKDTFVELEFIKPIKEVKEADFLDTHPIPLNFKENKCTVQFKPFQICNLLVSFSR